MEALVLTKRPPRFVTPCPGGVIKNFPAAVTTPNTVWAYVVGRDNHLYEVTPGTGGSWNTTNVSSAETVSGTASSRRAPTGVRTNYVHVPQILGAYWLTPPSTGWIFTGFSNPGSDLIGSPFANDKGAFVVDSHQSVWLWPAQGGSWTSLGGYVDR